MRSVEPVYPAEGEGLSSWGDLTHADALHHHRCFWVIPLHGCGAGAWARGIHSRTESLDSIGFVGFESQPWPQRQQKDCEEG